MFSNSQSDADPSHFECGDECAECPVKTERAEFEEAPSETLTEKCGEKWKEYGLTSLLQTVCDISEIAETNRSNWTIKTERLVSILTSERNRLAKIQRWNSRTSE